VACLASFVPSRRYFERIWPPSWSDNDPAGCELFEEILLTAGYSVSVAIEAAAGFDVLRCSTIDVVLVDLNMPEKAGLEVLAVIQRDFPAMKVVMVSSGYIPLPDGPLLDGVEVL
jgi:CheY-like chemotaxis protein